MRHHISALMILAVLATASSCILPDAGVQGTTQTGQRDNPLTEHREQRANEIQPPELVMDILGVRPGLVIGEVGAGRGRVTVHLADRVGSKGKIYANDINAASLEYLKARCQKLGLVNVETILSRTDDACFPKDSLDLVFMAWVYHHVDAPVPLLRSLLPSLKPWGVVAMAEPKPAQIEKEGRILTRESVGREAREAGFVLDAVIEDKLKEDNIFILRPAAPDTPDAHDRTKVRTLAPGALEPVNENESRLNRLQPPNQVMDAVGVAPGHVVAEIGAGRGRYAVQLAARVGETGKVYAEDIDADALKYLRSRCDRWDIRNIETVLGEVNDPRLPPDSLDLILIISSFHHFDDPVTLMRNARSALKRTGKLAIVEWAPRSDHEYLTPAQMAAKMKSAGYTLARTETFLLSNGLYIYIFDQSAEPGSESR